MTKRDNHTDTDKKRYIHDIKELPDDGKQADVGYVNKYPDLSNQDSQDLEIDNKSSNTENLENDSDFYEINEKVVSIKEGILIAINIFSVALLLFLLFKLPEEAKKVHDFRVLIQKSENIQQAEILGLEIAKEKTDKLKTLFLNDEGIVKFVNAIESLKQNNQSIKKIEFPSQEVIKDKTGNMAIPVIIELSGDWLELGKSLSEIESLPYLFRPVSVDIKPNKLDQGKFDIKYGGALYVSEQIQKSRNR